MLRHSSKVNKNIFLLDNRVHQKEKCEEILVMSGSHYLLSHIHYTPSIFCICFYFYPDIVGITYFSRIFSLKNEYFNL